MIYKKILVYREKKCYNLFIPINIEVIMSFKNIYIFSYIKKCICNDIIIFDEYMSEYKWLFKVMI